MKKILFIVLLSISHLSFSQSGWSTLSSIPITASRFDDIYFSNDSTGWAVNGLGKIYKTTDYGDSWTLQMDSSQYYFRSVEFLDNDTGFAGSLEGKLFKTTNGGANWNRIDQLFPQPVWGICGIGHFGNTIILSGKYSGPAFMLRSTDGGASWTYTDLSSVAGGLVDCWFQNQDTVFVSGFSTAATNHHGLIFRSTDAGQTWQQVAISNAVNSYCWKLQFPSATVGYSSVNEYSLSDTTRMMQTTDGGLTWQEKIVHDNINIDEEGIGFVNDTVGWVGGWSNGMYETTDGGDTWQYVNFGSNLNRFFFINQNLGYAAGLSVYRFNAATVGISNPPPVEIFYIHNTEIFPNPATTQVSFTLTIGRNTHVIFEVYDASGKLLKEFMNGYVSKNIYVFNFETGNLAPGVYAAALRTDEHFLTRKFVVLKK